MKSKISRQLHDPNYLSDVVKAAAIALLVMVLMVTVANLLSAVKQMLLD